MYISLRIYLYMIPCISIEMYIHTYRKRYTHVCISMRLSYVFSGSSCRNVSSSASANNP